MVIPLQQMYHGIKDFQAHLRLVKRKISDEVVKVWGQEITYK
jgi:hypothetical protein